MPFLTCRWWGWSPGRTWPAIGWGRRASRRCFWPRRDFAGLLRTRAVHWSPPALLLQGGRHRGPIGGSRFKLRPWLPPLPHDPSHCSVQGGGCSGLPRELCAPESSNSRQTCSNLGLVWLPCVFHTFTGSQPAFLSPSLTDCAFQVPPQAGTAPSAWPRVGRHPGLLFFSFPLCGGKRPSEAGLHPRAQSFETSGFRP